MKIEKQDVEHIAKLARLALTEEEKATYGAQLSGILSHIEKLKELDTSSVEPTSHVVGLSNVDREDRATPSLSVEEALANAPDRSGSFYRVPSIID